MRQVALKLIQLHGQGRLDDARDDKGAELNVLAIVEARQQLRDDGTFHHRLQFKGYTGHAHQHLAVALKPHQRCRTHLVLDDAARRGHHRLQTGVLVECEVAALHYLAHIALHVLVEHHLAAKVAAQRRLGDVVLGGAEASGHQHNVGLGESAVDGKFYLTGIVRDDLHRVHVPAARCHVTGNPARIGVGDLPDEQLVTDGNNAVFHAGLSVRFLVFSPFYFFAGFSSAGIATAGQP